jgi:hypothetical protein
MVFFQTETPLGGATNYKKESMIFKIFKTKLEKFQNIQTKSQLPAHCVHQ